MMRGTVYTLSSGASEEEINESIQAMVRRVQAYVPGYRLKQEVQFERFGATTPYIFPAWASSRASRPAFSWKSKGRRIFCRPMRQSRHHDVGGPAGGREDCRTQTAEADHIDVRSPHRPSLHPGCHAARRHACHPAPVWHRPCPGHRPGAGTMPSVDAIEIAHGDGPERLVLQLRLWGAYRLDWIAAGGQGRQEGAPHHFAAAGHRHGRGIACALRPGRDVGAGRHALYRGRYRPGSISASPASWAWMCPAS